MMIYLLAVVALSTFCESVPTVPRDNSHYVEGESRYFWMSDGDGQPTLVDLHEPVDAALLSTRNGSDNRYFLYTRNNPTEPQLLVYGNETSVTNSNFNASQNTIVISHGWLSNVNSSLNPTITSAFLSVYDGNVIVLDWNDLANSNYVTATLGVPEVGEYLGGFVAWLIDLTGGDWATVHLVGHSLGAHVVGNAGRAVGSLPARVTGMDPAGPAWLGNPNAISTDAGQYVEAIHTDGELLGIFIPVAHVDFYPNHGINPQPGCILSTCSHGRAWELFAATIEYPDSFVAYLCSSILEVPLGTCSGDELAMGNANVTKQGTSGIYYLTTGSEHPFYEE